MIYRNKQKINGTGFGLMIGKGTQSIHGMLLVIPGDDGEESDNEGCGDALT